MSQATRDANEESESDSTTTAGSSSRFSSSGSGCCATSSYNTLVSNGDESVVTSSNSSDRSAGRSLLQQNEPMRQSNSTGCNLQGQPQALSQSTLATSTTRLTNETKESSILNNNSDEVISRSQQETGQKCDTTGGSTIGATKTRHSKEPTSTSFPFRSGPDRPISSASVFSYKQLRQAQNEPQLSGGFGSGGQNYSSADFNSHLYPSTSKCFTLDRPTTTSFSDIRQALLKSGTGVSPSVMSSLNINSPLDRLSECDAITKRLMSSPIRTVNLAEKPIRRSHISEIEKSRRASLGTKSITEQVSLFASNQYNSLELNYVKTADNDARGDEEHSRYNKASPSGGGNNIRDKEGNPQRHQLSLSSSSSSPGGGRGNDSRLKQQQQQQQVRSLSVCQEETFKPRFRNNNSNHSSNLNRAVSLACESGSSSSSTSSSSKRLLTIIPLFGCDMKALEQYTRLGLILPPPIDSAIDHILAHGIDAIGIFRKSGVKSRILTLKQRIENNQDARVDEINVDNEFSIYDIADLVKMWFRELKPAPIVTRDLIKLITLFLQTNGIIEEQQKLKQNKNSSHLSTSTTKRDNPSMQDVSYKLMQQIGSTISPAHRVLISRAMSFFATISSKSEINQMTSQNLAICLTPSLCATETDQASILLAQRALKYCIDNHHLWANPS